MTPDLSRTRFDTWIKYDTASDLTEGGPHFGIDRNRPFPQISDPQRLSPPSGTDLHSYRHLKLFDYTSRYISFNPVPTSLRQGLVSLTNRSKPGLSCKSKTLNGLLNLLLFRRIYTFPSQSWTVNSTSRLSCDKVESCSVSSGGRGTGILQHDP